MSKGERVRVQVDGRVLSLSNLDKVLYPKDGFTKGEMIDYYTRITPVLLPHLRDRPVTRKRYPDGMPGQSFIEKNAPAGTPDWVRTVNLPTPGSAKGRASADYVMVDGLPTVVWLANLAAVELHVPQWRVGPRGGVHRPDLMVFDLDPGPPATIVDACQVACALRELLDSDGLTAYPKTSGKKGLHLYVPVRESGRTRDYAEKAALRLEESDPRHVTTRMDKRLRRRKVFIDWTQNDPGKTTVAPYSMRGSDRPAVSAPVTWDEVEACREPADLAFVTDQVLARVEEHGDLMAPLLEEGPPLP
ncbi:bifunctional non-homologous end joining protein LigD [Thermomonospora echinospora]|uniref:Bifunctional non-homologous end joining protein LigD n=1 Tax=Thermomonospora echinospora TaxID=1992 RepID=A0A1H5ZZZ9_9ACTN|nr:non-homologous end-joining DNA ligase [Thermomonospora echinospora]SEG41554.1 bifunctional non-homologous end joining protein LigD [Thermomonospora echinospora]